MPVRLMMNGLLSLSLLVIRMLAVLTPSAEGLKESWKVVLAPGITCDADGEVTVKSEG